jgi:energy-coupling factor transport system ATP-binding protein
MTPLLAASRAAFRYAGKTAAVGPFDLTVHPGELRLISGPSGCGKSTLARMLAGVIPHLYRGQLEGSVHVGNCRSDEVPLWCITADVGFVAQNPAAQILTGSVRGDIAFGLECLRLRRADLARRVDDALERFGLGALAERDPHTLSGGEQQRLVLAATAARSPRALVLDEPLSMLDGEAAAQVAGYTNGLRRSGAAVVTFEHRHSPMADFSDVTKLDLAGPAAPELSVPELPEHVARFRLVAEDITVDLGGCRILKGIDLDLDGGRVVALLGPNGAGKTTLLRTLAGLQKHRGRLKATSAAGTAAPRLGLCFQNPDRQIFNPTVRDEILYGTCEVDSGLYRGVLDLLGLAVYEETPPLLLSEGEKRRLGMAILLVRRGLHGLCVDEPTLGQDEDNRRRLGLIVRALARAGYLIVAATHDIEWAAAWCDEVVVLRDGRVAATERAPCDSATTGNTGATRSWLASRRSCRAELRA